MPNPTTGQAKPVFDPKAMGLNPQYVGRNMDVNDAHDTPEPGTLTGWGKSLGGGRTQQYDLQGNDLGITNDQTFLQSMMPAIVPAAMALGYSALSGMGAFDAFMPEASSLGAGGSDLATSAAWGNGSGLGADTVSAVGGGASGVADTVAPSIFNAASDSQLANVAIDAAGGDSLSGYTGSAVNAAVPTGLGEVINSAAPVATESANAASSAQNVFRAQEIVEQNLGAGALAQGGIIDTLASKASQAGSGVLDWIKSNPAAAGMLFQGITGAVASQSLVDAAAVLAQSRLDQIALQNKGQIDIINANQANKLADNARTSASVTGLRRPGLINQQPLTRNNGQRVFGAGGLINRG